MAPEILRHCGYSLPVDWWALGVVMLELLTGITTFTPLGEEDEDVFARILKYSDGDDSILLIEPDLDPHAADFVRQLLHPDPAKRMDGESAPSHPFFRGLDFYSLEKGLVTPPYVPQVKSATDTSHFKVFDESDDGPKVMRAALKRGSVFTHFEYSEFVPSSPAVRSHGPSGAMSNAAGASAGGGGGCCLVQ